MTTQIDNSLNQLKRDSILIKLSSIKANLKTFNSNNPHVEEISNPHEGSSCPWNVICVVVSPTLQNKRFGFMSGISDGNDSNKIIKSGQINRLWIASHDGSDCDCIIFTHFICFHDDDAFSRLWDCAKRKKTKRFGYETQAPFFSTRWFWQLSWRVQEHWEENMENERRDDKESQ